MHKLITAALLGAALATPLMAQGYPADDGRHDRGAQGDRPMDRRGPPPVRQDERRPGGYGDQGRHGQRQQDQGGQDQGHYRGQYQAQYRGQGYRPGDGGRGPVIVNRGRPGGDGRHWDGHDQRGRGWDDHRGGGYANGGWDQRWRSDNRYDWRGWRDSHRDEFAVRGYYAPGGYGYRRFERGYRIAPAFYDQRYWIADPYAYRLPPAEGPYRWVRYFDDVLLIDLRTGLIVDEEPGFFY